MKLVVSIDSFQAHKIPLQILKSTACKLQICPSTVCIALKFIYKSDEICRRSQISTALDELYMAALFLASKATERLLRLRDIINAYCVYAGRENQVIGEKYYLSKRRAVLDMEQQVLQFISFDIYCGNPPGGGTPHCLLLRTSRHIEARLTESESRDSSSPRWTLLMPSVIRAAWTLLQNLYYETQFYAEFSVSGDDLGAGPSSASAVPVLVTPFACSSRSLALGCLVAALQCLSSRGKHCRCVHPDETDTSAVSIAAGGYSSADDFTGLLRWVVANIRLFAADTTSCGPGGGVDPPDPLIVVELRLLLVWFAGHGRDLLLTIR